MAPAAPKFVKTKPKRIKVNDRMQRGYEYLLTKPTGKDFAPGFKPELTPKQMLRLGVFGGKYMTDCRKEFPDDWFEKAKLCPERHDPKLNFFGVNASQPLAVWREKGWIYRGRSARLVPMVLPLLSRAPLPG